jgi:putative methionine-R-sulfoxide reductase with GAF domain
LNSENYRDLKQIEMIIYKFLLSLRYFLAHVQNANQRQDKYYNSQTLPSEESRLLHRLNCISLNENESKRLNAHLTTILEERNQDKTSAIASDCMVLEMSEEELQNFSNYLGENSTCQFRAIVQSDNNQQRAKKLRIIGNHGLRLFNVIVKSHNSKELDQEYIYNKDDTCLSIPLDAALTEVHKTAQMNYQRLQSANNVFVAIDLVLGNMLRVVLETIRQLMSVDTVTVLLPTENGQQLAVCATIGLEEEILENIRIPLNCGFAGQIAASGKHMIVDDLSKIEVVSPILRNKGIRSMLGVPLRLKDQVNGVFHVGTLRSRQFTKDEVEQLQLVANRIGLAIEPLLKYWKMTSPNQAQLGHVSNKYALVRRERLKQKIILIQVTQSLKSLISINFTQRHILWRRGF